MHPDIAQTLARGRIADLHRDAAQRRRARAASRRPGIGGTLARRMGAVRATAAGWVMARPRPARASSTCCPA